MPNHFTRIWLARAWASAANVYAPSSAMEAQTSSYIVVAERVCAGGLRQSWSQGCDIASTNVVPMILVSRGCSRAVGVNWGPGLASLPPAWETHSPGMARSTSLAPDVDDAGPEALRPHVPR
jgi:hypothetical protein